jgi:GABA permease
MRRYLIVANQTLGADELVQFVRTRAQAEPSEFFIVVPATPIMEMAGGAEGLAAVGGSTVMPSSPEHARELAQERLETALAQLQGIGSKVDGQVGHRDPIQAVESALKERPCDEIVVSTLPKRMSRWLHQDLPRRLEHKTHLPVTHVGATT